VFPAGEALAGIEGQRVSIPSHSPFGLRDVGDGPEDDPPTDAVGTLYLPDSPAAGPAPAVVLLHGAAGPKHAREHTYGRQFAAMGVAAVVLDVFAARRDLATGFTERLLNITEAMLLADAYSTLKWLDDREDIDAGRVALIGFSYGGMTSVLAAYRQVADLYAPDGQRFAAHAAYYGPCIARFDDPSATGAPVLMLQGGQDEITYIEDCETIAEDLGRGGAPTDLVVYEDAWHQWDGGLRGPWRAGRTLKDCSFRVSESGMVRDAGSWVPMMGPVLRKAILALCVDDSGYLIGGNDGVRRQSNAKLAAFLNPVFAD